MLGEARGATSRVAAPHVRGAAPAVLGFGSRSSRRQGGPARAVSVQSRFVWIVSHVAELTIFFGAAAALGAGLLGLR